MKIVKLDKRHRGYGTFTHRVKPTVSARDTWDAWEIWLNNNYGVIPGYYRHNKHSRSHLYENGRWGLNHARGGYYVPTVYFKSEQDLTW